MYTVYKCIYITYLLDSLLGGKNNIPLICKFIWEINFDLGFGISKYGHYLDYNIMIFY